MIVKMARYTEILRHQPHERIARNTMHVTLTLRLLSTENQGTEAKAVEAALDRIPPSVISALHAAGFTLSLPIEYEVGDDQAFVGDAAIFDQDIDA